MSTSNHKRSLSPTGSPPTRKRTTACGAAGVLLLGVLSGCAEFDLTQDFSWPGSEPKPQVPKRVTDVWEYVVLRQPGQPGVRGFGGRIIFYGKDGKKQVKVDGTLTVFAFDAGHDDPAWTKPEKKFVFPAEKLPDHYRKSDLGPCYDFWLPWDEVGGPPREIRLIARLETTSGEVVIAEESHHTLSGPTQASVGGIARKVLHKNLAHGRTPAPAGMIEAVSHEAPAQPPPSNLPRMTTDTINLTPNFTRQVIEAGNGQPRPVTASRGGIPTGPANAAGAALIAQQNPPAFRTPAGPVAEQDPAPGVYSGGVAQQGEAHRGWSTRSAPARFPARRATSVGPRYDPVRRQPHPAMWPSRLPPTPRSGWSAGYRDTPSTAEPNRY